MTEIHQQRQVAEAFGAEAERYDRSRPSYPAAMVERIVAESPGTGVLDVGCGTGIAARLFAAAGCRVLGVEIDPRMAEVARRSGIECEVAGFEDWPAGGRLFDAVIAGQAWHWIDPARGAAKAAEVLRPRGRLALFWNAFEPPAQIRRGFAEVQGRVAPALPNPWSGDRPIADGYAGMVAAAATGLDATGAFGPVEQWRFEWEQTYSRQAWLDVVQTHGGMGARMPAEWLDGVGGVIDAHGGSFVMHYTTVVGTTTRRG